MSPDHFSSSPQVVFLYRQLARSGDASAAAAIGKRLLNGADGFEQDADAAIQFLESASHKFAKSRGLLGYCYLLGVGVDRNLTTAYQLLRSAGADDGDALALSGLGYMLFYGIGV